MKDANLLFLWAEEHLSSIKADHLPGVENTEADWLSRQNIVEGDWSLHPQVFEQITKAFGRPEIDLFASRDNAQVPNFLSRFPDPIAMGTNALIQPWPQALLYAFPPIPLIQAVLQRVKQQQATLILVAPDWPCRPWYPSIVNMMTGTPLRLPNRPDLLRQGPLTHPNPSMYRLTAWLLSGRP